MMTGSEGVSFRLPQLFFSQQRLRKKRRGGGEKGEIFRTGEKKLNICLAHPHPRAETILPHSWPKATDKRGMRGVEKKRQKNFKKGRKGTTAHPRNSERAFKSEKPAGQSVTLILKSNAAPMQPHSACAHTHTHKHGPTTSYHSSVVLSREPAGQPSTSPSFPKSPLLHNKSAPTPNHLPPLHLASNLSCPSLALPFPPPPPCQTASLPSCAACPLPPQLCY